MGFFSNRFKADESMKYYDPSWYRSLSDEELKSEREEIRLKHCAGDPHAWDLLRKFDDEIRRREPSDSDNDGYPVRREHGWYLSNDE